MLRLMIPTAIAILALQLTTSMPADIPQGAVVRIAVIGGPRISARFFGMADDSIILSTRAGTVRVSRLAIDSIWTRHRPIGPHVLRDAWGGALLGVAIELIRSTRLACHDVHGILAAPACRLTFGELGRGAATGAGIGGAIGFVIGAASPVWKRRFPSVLTEQPE